MKIKYLKLINKYGRLKYFLFFLILFLVFEITVMFPLTPIGKYFIKSFPEGFKFLDLQFAYSYDDAFFTLSKLDNIGKFAYIRNLLMIDIAAPVLFSLFFLTLFGLLFNVIKPKFYLIKLIILIPVITCILDLTENIFELIMILLFPNLNVILVISASFITTIKLSLMYICYLLIPILIIWMFIKIIYRTFIKKTKII